MKILIADKIAAAGVAYIKAQKDMEVIEAYGSSPDEIVELAKDVDAIAVRSETKITAEVIAAATRLKAVGRAGVGVDNINVDAATERGIVVMNTPGGNTLATAELTFTHLLCGSRPIAQANAALKAGRWDRGTFKGKELNGKVLGICGLGRIGTEIAKRAQSFGMKVLAYDPFLSAARADSLGVELADLDRICRESDSITVHMPLTEETHYMLDEAAFAKMKDGVRVFNCARGGIIKESALAAALKSGKVAAAGLDVYEDEPLAEDSELRTLDNLVLTPHLGASTDEAQESVGVEIAESLVAVLRGEIPRNAINMPSVDPQTLKKLRPYLKLAEALGTFLQQITPAGVDKLRITYTGGIVDLDALPVSRAIQRGYLLRISGDEVNDVNAPLRMKRLGIEVEITKSSGHSDYTELVQVETICSSGKGCCVSGTLFGKNQTPRIVAINGHDVEVNTRGTLLVMINKDIPGIIGMLGTVLGKDLVNIANMSLSRGSGEGLALSVFELDTAPSEAAVAEISGNEAIDKFKIIQL